MKRIIVYSVIFAIFIAILSLKGQESFIVTLEYAALFFGVSVTGMIAILVTVKYFRQKKGGPVKP